MANSGNLRENQRSDFRHYIAIILLGWTIAVGVSFWWNSTSRHQAALELARIQARTAYDKDVWYRSWNANHGGVYVPISDYAEPNPYLTEPNRDVTTIDGLELTMINPAYMTRQVHELQAAASGVKGHITSLKPIRPANAPDLWERKALEQFEAGTPEVSELQTMDGTLYMRLMKPLSVTENCLKCHAEQGYKLGDIRGGISVSVPMQPILSVDARERHAAMLEHGLFWLLGVIGLMFGARNLYRHMIERDQAEAELRIVNEELVQARDQALDAAKTKSRFLANMSHEIRTPMNGVLGMTELLRRTETSPRQRQLIDTLYNSADALLVIINDILDFSKLEADSIELEHVDFNLRSCLEEGVDLLAPKAHNKGLEVILLVESEVPQRVNGDPVRLRQILLNLLSNAIKFTETGEIVIRVSLVRFEEDSMELQFTVRDTGIGIPADRMDRLFKSFSQVDSSTTRKYGGTGLGLAISQRLVQAMSGAIEVESEPGTGTTFRFTVCLARAAKREEAAPVSQPRVSLEGLRVLIVDDNSTNRYLLTELLDSWGCLHKEATDGPEALGIIDEAAREQRYFDVALIDYEMPGMNGATLAEEINARENLPTVALILLTSLPQSGDYQRFQAAGFAGYLPKPVRQRHLFETIAMAVSRDARTSDSEDAATEMITHHTVKEASENSVRVLLVEDNLVNRTVAVGMLKELGCVCDIACNGEEALAALDAGEYSLIFMDCQMPVMDGFEATEAIRNRDDSKRDIPIVALTAGAMQEDRDRCVAAGMNDYISKPFKVQDLHDIIKKYSM